MRSMAATARRVGWLIAGLGGLGGFAGLAGLTRPAAGHVAPAIADNNRYLKLTPLGDRVRLAYTVFYGAVPGTALRREMDTNHDGAVDDAESQAFGGRLAAQLAAQLELTVDGARRPVTWSQIAVGMGTPSGLFGPFSVDLIAAICLTPVRGAHAIELRDRFELAHPGETEIRFEDSPGIGIDRARVGDDDQPGIDYKIIGPTPVLGAPGPAGGIALAFTAGPRAVVAPDASCARPAPAPAPAAPIGAIAGAAVALAALSGAIIVIRTVRRRAR